MAGAGEDKAYRFFVRYRHVFLFLGIVLIAQLFLATRIALITDVDLSPILSSLQTSENLQKETGIKASIQSENLGAGKAGSSSEGIPIPSHIKTPCEITGKETLSAIRRAKTDYCKEHLANITCQITSHDLYSKRLPRFCKRDGFTYMKRLGCFQDDKKNRVLPDHYVLLKTTNSPQNCVDLCLQSGFPYAGVEYSVECFCGNAKPSEGSIVDLSLCNMKCPLSSTENNTELSSTSTSTCGGYFIVDVYETGVFRDVEVNQQVIDFKNASENMLEQSTARIVFFLTLNGRALRQVIRLIKSLFHERHYFYIHVDARQDYMFRELLTLSYKLPKNFRFMRERKSTIWGGASLLKVLFGGMTELIQNRKEWNWDWDYVINLSESDFPLKTTTQLDTFLTLNKGKNFLKSHGKDVQNFILKQGLDKTFVECEYRMWRIGDRKLPAGILIDGGSDWIALHYDFVNYIVTTKDDLVNGLLTVFEHTLLPAESFFHIVLRNSAMCNTFVDNNLHVTNWKRKLGCKCQYKNIVDWCGCSPNDFRLTDWSRLEATHERLLFFGRKFEPVVNQAIINQLEYFLYPQRSEINLPTFDRYWQNIYHHHDLTPKPNDATLTLGSSLARIAAKLLQYETDEKLTIKTKLKELNVFVQNDQVDGILVLYDLYIEESLVLSAESWFKQQNYVQFEPLNDDITHYHSKIQYLQIGSEYDQKEQIFRNFAGSIGPLSEPTLAYHVYTDDPSFNLTFVWTNPLQSVQAVQNFKVQSGNTANFAKPALKPPLAPGNWTVKVLSVDGHLLAQTNFLVSMSEFYHGQSITQPQHKILNVGSERNVAENLNQAHWTPEKLLHDKIDENIKKFYIHQATCIVNDPKIELIEPPKIFELKPCLDSSWSTVFPDPKSSIIGIDPKTGLLLP